MIPEKKHVTENNQDIDTKNENPYKSYRITMELPIFCAMLSVSLSGAIISNLILYRTCVHSLNHTREECQDFLSAVENNGTRDLEETVQKYGTVVSSVKTILESVTPAVLALFLGVWSDRHGRKPLVVWPLLGMTITGGLIVIYSILDMLGPWWLILTSVPMSVSGGYTAMFTGSFCYISDISTKDNRSLRMTLIQASMTAGTVIGAVISSFLLRAVGNTYLLLISASLYALAYIFTSVCLKESLTGIVQGRISSVFDLKLMKEMFVTCFKKRPNNNRAQVLLLASSNSMFAFVSFGITGLLYWYTRQKLQWAVQQYTIYSAIHTTLSSFGACFGVIVIQKLLNVSDLAFAAIAMILAITDDVIIALATLTWHMYLGAIISNLILYRTCVHSLNNTQEECQDFLSAVTNNGSHDLEETVQRYATIVLTVKTILESMTPAILSLFLGVWSDRHGRKPLVVWPLLGMTITGGLIVIYSMLDMLGPWWLILTSVPMSVSGGYTAMFTGSFCYICDISTKDNRSLSFFVILNNNRAQVLLLAVANSMFAFVSFGITGLLYWYTRQKLQWAVQQYTIYSAVHTTLSSFGACFGVIIIQKLLNLSDLAFAAIAMILEITDDIIIAFATLTWHMYLGASICLFQSLSAPLIRSLLSKILPSEDVAKVFALMGAIEGVSPLISPALYYALYASTISTFPGTIYLLSAGISTLCVTLLGLVHYYRRKESRTNCNVFD